MFFTDLVFVRSVKQKVLGSVWSWISLYRRDFHPTLYFIFARSSQLLDTNLGVQMDRKVECSLNLHTRDLYILDFKDPSLYGIDFGLSTFFWHVVLCVEVETKTFRSSVRKCRVRLLTLSEEPSLPYQGLISRGLLCDFRGFTLRPK